MRPLRAHLRWIGLLLLLEFILQTGWATHRALLVGIGQYPSESGWRAIHSENDIRLLTQRLRPSYQVETLVNEAATYQAILHALKELATHTQPGDTVLISFSGHGQQVVAVGKDHEPDGLDEALIPYDALSRYSEAYQGDRHLIDDTLSVAVDAVRTRAGAGGFVLVLLDACHSGDSFREDSVKLNYRGGYPVFGDPRLIEQLPVVSKYQPKHWPIPDTPDMASVIYLSACQSYQLNMEMTPDDSLWYGSLTYAFSQVYPTLGLADLPALCESICQRVMSYHPTTRQYPEVASNMSAFQPQVEATPTAVQSATPTQEESIPVLYWIIGLLILLFVLIISLWHKRK